MPPALTLQQAAGRSFDDLNIRWQTDSMKNVLTLFWGLVIQSFPVTDEGGAPIRNWLAVIAANADNLPLSDVPLADLTTNVKPIYGICWLGDKLRSLNRITVAQANAILGAYNAFIAV